MKNNKKDKIPLSKIKLDKKTYKEGNKISEDNSISINLMVSGMLIGTSMGLILDNLELISVGSFLGLGLGYVVETIIKVRK
ncbi:hypothetical protein [Paraclostridium bifermentans]|uniref:hypothetical protein n=1 Tax=Paraclostridium bifermentans TaxID=1490 RepID=UPI00359C7125